MATNRWLQNIRMARCTRPTALGMKARGFGLAKFGKQQTTQFFQVGTKVYPSKIQVNAEKDQVVMSIVACDSCNNTSPTTFYKADIVFQFAKGGLAKMSAPQVEDAIGGLLAIDDSGGDQGGNNRAMATAMEMATTREIIREEGKPSKCLHPNPLRLKKARRPIR